MPYQAPIKRDNPTAIMFLIDQSQSMEEPASQGGAKQNLLANAINRLIYELILQCTKKEGPPYNYFHVGVLGYGAQVGPAFQGDLKGKGLVPLPELAEKPFRIEQRQKKESDGCGGIIDVPVKFPVWIEPLALNGTPMAEAMQEANRILSGWVTDHKTCFPPMVFNITDGEPNTDPTSQASNLRPTTGRFSSLTCTSLAGPAGRYCCPAMRQLCPMPTPRLFSKCPASCHLSCWRERNKKE